MSYAHRINPIYELCSYYDNGFFIDEICYIISSMTFIMTPKYINWCDANKVIDRIFLLTYHFLDKPVCFGAIAISLKRKKQFLLTHIRVEG